MVGFNNAEAHNDDNLFFFIMFFSITIQSISFACLLALSFFKIGRPFSTPLVNLPTYPPPECFLSAHLRLRSVLRQVIPMAVLMALMDW